MAKEKETYLKEWKTRLEEGKSDIDRLQAEMAKSQTTDHNPTIDDFIEALKRNWSEREQEYKELEKQSGEAWEVLKEGFVKSFRELESAIKEATTKFGQESTSEK